MPASWLDDAVTSAVRSLPNRRSVDIRATVRHILLAAEQHGETLDVADVEAAVLAACLIDQRPIRF